jgi:hypothetical protein
VHRLAVVVSSASRETFDLGEHSLVSAARIRTSFDAGHAEFSSDSTVRKQDPDATIRAFGHDIVVTKPAAALPRLSDEAVLGPSFGATDLSTSGQAEALFCGTIGLHLRHG